MTVKIVVADQMDLALEGIKAVLGQQNDFEVLGTYQRLDSLIEVLTKQRPQVIVLGDRIEPEMDVLSLVDRVRSVAPRSQLIIMSTVPDGLVVHELFSCGVNGYLYKNDSLRDILAEAIQTVMLKRPYLSPTANTHYLVAMKSDRAGWQIDAEALGVLRLLADGYRPQQIALMREMPLRRAYWVVTKLKDRFAADTNAHLIARAAEEGFLP